MSKPTKSVTVNNPRLRNQRRRGIDVSELSPAQQEKLALRGETFVVAWSFLLIALLALSYSYSHQLLLLYGDAVAHMHIARRLIDSIEPGFRQMGSVWLPLPHLLLLPFIWRMGWWQTGIAGAFPSMGAYVLGVAGLYRLARQWLSPQFSFVALALFALNPGLLYMQATAMNEPLFLAEMIWAVLLLVEYRRELESNDHARASRLLVLCGAVLVGAVFTRYDGWIFAAFAWVIALLPMLRRDRWQTRTGGAFVLFTVMVAVAPLVWMGYCAKQFGDPLDFMRGPYSAKAIDARTTKPGSPHYPGWHSMPVAELYFLKAAELGAVIAQCANLLLTLAVAGTLAAAWKWRKAGILPALLLWVPAPFYAYSVAYGYVPIFIPLWWPHSFYNVRYGMEMLPVFALALAFFVAWLAGVLKKRWPVAAPYLPWAFIVLLLASDVTLAKKTPLVLGEAINNSRSRVPYEAAYARALAVLPENATILAYTSEHPGAYQQAGIPLKHTINESDYYEWTPALKNPAASADYVITTDNDPVAKAVAAHPQNLTLINIVCSTDQPCVRIYQSNRHAAGGSITQK
ncbi:ArnT family glycosyltransferase [Silvibacterium sp.]|uniref:ArnT family glycosyltransferase n=1 Tax=Silvibacterium sp. TaxID=1964179 RepID=UPI0039E41C74